MITIDVNYGTLKGGARIGHVRLREILRAVERALPRGKREVSLAFIGDAEMRRLNTTWRHKEKTTDVLSFGDGKGNGEILISYPVAVRQARELGHGVLEEVAFLFVHGLLHLHGFDHIKPQDARRMFPLQERLLRSLGVDPRL